jgi:hypothetical protein
MTADPDKLEAELATMTDDEVRRAYLATDGRGEVADLLAGECQRRGIDL